MLTIRKVYFTVISNVDTASFQAETGRKQKKKKKRI